MFRIILPNDTLETQFRSKVTKLIANVTMNIGDKVRSMRGNEEGIITSFPNNLEVEVEIEEGFRIPFLRSDLVLVNTEERSYFREEDAPKKKAANQVQKKLGKTVQAQKGLYLAFVHYNDKIVDLCFINNTDLEIAYMVGEAHERLYYGVKSAIVQPRSFENIQQLELAKFEEWPTYVVQALSFYKGVFKYQSPLEKKLKVKAATFHKSKREAPVIKRAAYLFQLDGENLPPVDPHQLKAQILSTNTPKHLETPSAPITSHQKRKGDLEIDLHIEKITPHHASLSKDSILEMQLEAFEKAFDQAIAEGYDELIAIHGVGNGILKIEVQRRLSGHPNVDYFKDARKERFGYGATAIKIK